MPSAPKKPKPKRRKPLYKVTLKSGQEYLTTDPVLPRPYGMWIKKLNPEIFVLTTR